MGYIVLSFYFISGLLAVATAITFILIYRRQREIRNIYLCLFFMCVGIIGIATGGPALLALDSNIRIDAYRWGHFITISASYLMLLFGIAAQRSLSREGYDKLFFASAMLTVAVGSSVITASYFTLPQPQFLEGGLVLFKMPAILHWVTGLYVLTYGFIWSYIFFSAARLIFTTLNRLRTLTLSATGLFLGLSTLLLSVGKTPTLVFTGMMFFITACIVTFIVYVLPATHATTRGLDHI